MTDKFMFIAVFCIGMIAMKESSSMWEDLSTQEQVEALPLEMRPDSCILLIVQENCIEE